METKTPEEPTLPSKRKPDLACEEHEEHPNKAQKLQSLNDNSQLSEDKTHDPEKECVKSDAQVHNDQEEGEEEEEEADGNGEVVVDRKGKGILIEDGEDEDSSDDDDNSSDGGSQSDEDSDLSDDPLTEVDLDNILPSRTRRRVIQPGEFIANDLDDDDDSDSDDGDA